MRRPPQDRGATRSSAPRHLPHPARGAAGLAAVAALILVLAAPAAAQRGCAGKPGGPDQGAVFQYCPHQGKAPHKSGGMGSAGSAGSGAAEGVAAGGATAGATTGKAKANAKLLSNRAAGGSGEAQLPLSDYPSTGGINLLVLLLAVLALALAVAYGARRWRRSHPPAS
jgi:LPXTG-motif cell wall-anchored protein